MIVVIPLDGHLNSVQGVRALTRRFTLGDWEYSSTLFMYVYPGSYWTKLI